MNDIDLDKQREEIIEEIKRVFPIKPRPKELVLSRFRNNWEGKPIIDKLEGKSWADFIGNSSFAYSFNDVDFISVMDPKAFAYYLPAFLVLTMMRPADIVSRSVFINIKDIASKLSTEKLQVLISYLTYQDEYSRKEHDSSFAEDFENLFLYLLSLLDEKKPKA